MGKAVKKEMISHWGSIPSISLEKSSTHDLKSNHEKGKDTTQDNTHFQIFRLSSAKSVCPMGVYENDI